MQKFVSNNSRAEHDYYPTPKSCVEALYDREFFSGSVWECAAGRGDISNVFLDRGHEVLSTDLIDRGYDNITGGVDFLKTKYTEDMPHNIITNPPFNLAFEFVKHAFEMSLLSEGKVAMFLRLAFLESKKRRPFFLENKPSKIYVFSERQTLWKNGEDVPKGRSGTTPYAWFVWSGKNRKDRTELEWI